MKANGFIKIGDLVVMNIEYIAATWGQHAADRCKDYSTGIVLSVVSQDGLQFESVNVHRDQLKKYTVMWSPGFITTEHWSHVISATP